MRSAEVRERELHLQFATAQRFKAGTRGAEWFDPSDELLTYIAEHARQPESLDAPRFVAEQTVSNEALVSVEQKHGSRGDR
jgi:hypothetical protein